MSRRLRRPAYSGAVVAWLIFEDALLPGGYLKAGPLEFFSGRDYPASLRDGWWRPEGAPEELGDRWSELFLPESLPERECVLVRVQLAPGPLAGAAERATGLVRQALHMAYDRSQWKLMDGVALVRDGRWFGTRPKSTLDWPHFPGMDVSQEPTSHGLETLDREVLEALGSAEERALDVAADREWLANVAELADPAHRVALTVRLLERRLHTMRHEPWARAVEHYFADWWAEEQILDALVDAAEVGIGALPDPEDPSPQLTLRFRELMLPWSSGLSFRVRPAEIIRNAAELAAHLTPKSFARRQIEDVVDRTRTAADAAAWLGEIKRDFRLLITRATRQRNAVLHGNDTITEVVETVDPFLRRLASMLVDQQLGALVSGRTLDEQLARLRKRAQIRDERLAAGEEPAEVLLQ